MVFKLEMCECCLVLAVKLLRLFAEWFLRGSRCDSDGQLARYRERRGDIGDCVPIDGFG